MSDAIEFAAALASKLRGSAGVQRARTALDIARIGFGGDLKSAHGTVAGAERRRSIILTEPGVAKDRDGAETAAPSRNVDTTFIQQPVAPGSTAGVLGAPSTPFRNGLDAAGMKGSATRAKLTMLGSSGIVAPSNGPAAEKTVWPATAAVGPRYIARAIEPEAVSAAPGGRAPSPKPATSAAGRVAATAVLQAQLAYGARATGEGPVGRALQSGAPAGENARAAAISSAPVATSPARGRVTVLPDQQGLQNSSATWNGTQGTGSDQSPSASTPDSRQAANSGPTGGDVYLDGTLMGRWMARNLANQASRPASGGAGFDPRRGVFPTGAMIGG